MKSVLIIEDNTDIRENICELLALEGYDVLCAKSGPAGIILAKENMPDVIFCDLIMPEQDGYEVLRMLRDDPDTAGLPFFFLSASVEKTSVQTGIDLGADGYIQKPFEPFELFNAISKCPV
ncbi:MAG: hypothetical protein NVSMB24_34390 [Mucilaginibacter sp.]